MPRENIRSVCVPLVHVHDPSAAQVSILAGDVAMSMFRVLPLALTILGSSVAHALADEKAVALAARIDQHISAGWQSAKVEPAPRSDDAEFLRRITIDLAGRIPTVAEVRAFLSDPAPDKRERLIAKL